MVVLDAIHWIQSNAQPDLACRWNCKAAKCGSCSAEINGRPSLMCKTRLSDFPDGEAITVEPMRTFPLIRDLVTDVSWNYRVNERIAPFQPPADLPPEEWRWQQEDIERSQEFRKCIECFLCQDVCHVLRNHETEHEFAGPRFLVRIAGLEMHPIDEGDRLAHLKDEAGIGYCNITKCCTEVCPEHIKITDNADHPAQGAGRGRVLRPDAHPVAQAPRGAAGRTSGPGSGRRWGTHRARGRRRPRTRSRRLTPRSVDGPAPDHPDRWRGARQPGPSIGRGGPHRCGPARRGRPRRFPAGSSSRVRSAGRPTTWRSTPRSSWRCAEAQRLGAESRSTCVSTPCSSSSSCTAAGASRTRSCACSTAEARGAARGVRALGGPPRATSDEPRCRRPRQPRPRRPCRGSAPGGSEPALARLLRRDAGGLVLRSSVPARWPDGRVRLAPARRTRKVRAPRRRVAGNARPPRGEDQRHRDEPAGGPAAGPE